MDTTTQILSGLFGVAIVILIAPRILAVNQGKVLRNIALWAAIFLALAVAYKVAGPAAIPTGTGSAITQPIDQAMGSSQQPTNNEEPDPEMQINEENGFSPPQGD